MTSSLSATGEVILAGITTGIIFVLELALWRSKTTLPVKLATSLFGMAISIYALCSTAVIGSVVGQVLWLRLPLAAFVSADIGLYALMVTAIFVDRKLNWRDFAPPVLLAFTGLAALNSKGTPQVILLAVYVASCVFLLGRSIVTLLAGWPGDLVEARRRMRQPVVGATCLIAISALADIAVSTAARAGKIDSWFTLQREAVLTLVTMFVGFEILTTRGLPQAPATAPAGNRDDADDGIAVAVAQVMAQSEIWRREGLTIKALASELELPEYRLRRVIVDRMGFRNFSAFINSHRIEAAKLRMIGVASGTVAEIAYDVGFRSLSAFNRAFREIEGESPTSWRGRHLR